MPASRFFRVAHERLRAVFRKDTLDAELERELAFHFDHLVQEFVEGGLSAEEARHAARRTLGTIASLAPLMGLFGTVVGMIEIFGAQGGPGMTTNPAQLAHGISVALYNTGFGLLVAIPSMIFYRHYRAKVDGLVVEMEMQAVKLVEIVHGERT